MVRFQSMGFAAAETEKEKTVESKDEKPSEAELKANREEWGLKYDDEAYKFEKEWKAIADKI